MRNQPYPLKQLMLNGKNKDPGVKDSQVSGLVKHQELEFLLRTLVFHLEIK